VLPGGSRGRPGDLPTRLDPDRRVRAVFRRRHQRLLQGRRDRTRHVARVRLRRHGQESRGRWRDAGRGGHLDRDAGRDPRRGAGKVPDVGIQPVTAFHLRAREQRHQIGAGAGRQEDRDVAGQQPSALLPAARQARRLRRQHDSMGERGSGRMGRSCCRARSMRPPCSRRTNTGRTSRQRRWAS
jgi:hypothetical protein